MDNAKTIEWVKSLKAGDKVIANNYRGQAINILTVKKITQSGIIRTDGGNFKPRCFDRYSVSSYGTNTTVGFAQGIVPYSDDKAEEAKKYMEQEQKNQELISELSRFEQLIYEYKYYRTIKLSLEQVLKLNEILCEAKSNTKLL